MVAAAFGSSPHDDNPAARAARHEGIGLWKAYTPQDFKGEFDSYYPIGLIGGAFDCSINWRDQDGKLYCFASGTSLVYVQDWPKAMSRTGRKPIFARQAKPMKSLHG